MHSAKDNSKHTSPLLLERSAIITESAYAENGFDLTSGDLFRGLSRPPTIGCTAIVTDNDDPLQLAVIRVKRPFRVLCADFLSVNESEYCSSG